jgi:hypothetical protein
MRLYGIISHMKVFATFTAVRISNLSDTLVLSIELSADCHPHGTVVSTSKSRGE